MRKVSIPFLSTQMAFSFQPRKFQTEKGMIDEFNCHSAMWGGSGGGGCHYIFPDIYGFPAVPGGAVDSIRVTS